MTDSMKFGPEWLRNLSTETVPPFSGNNTGGGGGGIGSYSGEAAKNNSTTSTNGHSGGVNATPAAANSTNSGVRNTFSEFRYGREEMLLLFDRQTSLPEILPQFKNIFVERVQFPLALVPNTDEEAIAAGAPAIAQKATWLQRSPIPFNTSTRGSIRGGIVDRGRMRGKPSYHPAYQRSVSTFEDDGRSSLIKAGRSTDALAANTAAIGLSGSESWNSTTIFSPRKDFGGGHAKNMENWRRSRNEAYTGDASAGGIPSSNPEGWRMNASSFPNGHTRLNKLSNWRDEENLTNTDVGGELDKSKTGGGVGKPGVGGGLPKDPGANTNANLWALNNAPNGVASNCSSFESNNEDFLPEWATENTSGIGGSFDATGAFHDDEVGLRMKYFAEQKYLREKDKEAEAAKNTEANSVQQAAQQEGSSEPPPTANAKQAESKETSKEEEANNDISESHIKRKLEEDYTDASNKPITPPETEANSNDNSVEYADNMMEVADDMVEKLVMDDSDDIKRISTSTKTNVSSLSECNDISKASVLASPLQPDQNLGSLNALNHNGFPPSSIGAQAADVGLSAPFSLNAAAMSLDHSQNPIQLFNMQQQQHQQHQQLQQQMSSVNMGMKPTVPPPSHNAATNLWFYRDPQSKVQGPFSALEMAEWYRAGYFNDNLYVRRACDGCFRALGDLIKICNGHVPFTHTHLIPIGAATNPVHVASPLTIAQQAAATSRVDFFHKNFGNNNLQHNDLKANATAAAESLSKALRSIINLDDMSKIVNLHMQSLQERFVRCAEIEIIKELTDHESFRQLDSAEQDAIVRQKFQTIVLPEYLTSLTGLSNTLALLNPSAESLLYNTIIECSKKREIFHSQQQAAAAALSSTEHQLHHSVAGFSGPDNFISQHQVERQHPTDTPSNTNSDPLQNFLLDMSSPAPAANSIVDPHFLGSPPTTASNTSNNVHNNATANPTVRLWMSQFNDRQQLSQQQQLFNQPAAAASNYKWNSGPLFGMPSISLPKPVPMWNVSEIEQHRLDQQQQLQQQQQQQQQQQLQQQQQQQPLRTEQSGFELQREQDTASQQHQLVGETSKMNHVSELSSEQNVSKIIIKTNTELEEKQKQQQHAALKQQQSSLNDKNQYNLNHSSNNNNNNAANKSYAMKQQKEDISDAAKEEAKRQHMEQQRQLAQQQQQQQHQQNHYQFEEVKSRSSKQQQHAEEKKQQQLLQQQQQQQRQKAAADASSKNANVANHHAAPSNNNNNIKIVKEQQKKSQVAPWVNQALATKNQIDLAEIQKAEKRERRADQQRQLEMQEKQLQLAMANAAQENVLKWNRSSVPVKSFAEIQAEEARRLAKEQIEQQKRKAEQEQQYQSSVEASGLNSSAFIWGNNKLWAASASNLSGFWEDTQKEQKPIKDSVSAVQRNSKMQSSSSPNSARNGKKQPGDANVASASSLHTSNSHTALSKKNTAAAAAAASSHATGAAKNAAKNKTEDTKNNSKANHSAKKGSSADCEADFVNWCTDSLNNMKTEVDVPTFVSFLSDLESPDEIREYIRAYLGETKEFLDFAKQFLERRSKLKSLKRAQNAHIDDLCKPAMAITPSANENGDNKGKAKKPKKNKMTKLDARILGFSVTAAEGRINVGDRDYVDGS